jgi:hypothetical protein
MADESWLDNLFGSKDGVETAARMAPVVGSMATMAPGR